MSWYFVIFLEKIKQVKIFELINEQQTQRENLASTSQIPLVAE